MSPGLLIAAPRSGSGKTTITLAVMRALSRRGLVVQGAKCGPDYIDPAFHAAATGRPSFNLDSFAMPPALLEDLVTDHAAADLVIAEGSMGLFDGVTGGEGATGASADIAARFGWPVVLVLDVSGQAQSAAATALGFRSYDPRVTIAGVILNNVASERHRRLAADGMARIGLPVLGVVMRRKEIILPERHLGLVQAGETADLAARLDALADLAEASIDLDALLRAARQSQNAGDDRERQAPSPRFAVGRVGVGGSGATIDSRPIQAGTPPTPSPFQPKGGGRGTAPSPSSPSLRPPGRPSLRLPPPGRRIALAQDAAFSFVYPHVLDGWRQAGAEIVPFSPLEDEPPGDDCDACWLPGGYPELHAGRLAGNARFLDGLRGFAASRLVHGECGGYMVLGEALEDAEGVTHAMAGLLPVVTSFARRRLHLGYRIATLARDSVLGSAGAVLVGHEFHYASVTAGAPGEVDCLAQVRDAHGTDIGPVGHLRGRVSGTFFHAIAPR